MKNNVYRVAAGDDLDTVDRLLRQLATDLDDPYTATRNSLKKALFSTCPPCFAILAEYDRSPCGIGFAAPVFSTMRGGCGVYVSDLWVAADRRGLGIGQGLLSQIADQAKSLWDARFLKLAVYDDNPKAHKFYQELGFVTVTGECVMTIETETLAHRGHHASNS